MLKLNKLFSIFYISNNKRNFIIIAVFTIAFAFSACGGGGSSDSPGGEDGNGHTHTWGEWTVITNPTCTTTGEGTRECTKCGETDPNTIIPIDPEAHAWTAWTVTTPATVLAAGVETESCSRCSILGANTRPITQLTPDVTIDLAVGTGNIINSSPAGSTILIKGISNGYRYIKIKNATDIYIADNTTILGFEEIVVTPRALEVPDGAKITGGGNNIHIEYYEQHQTQDGHDILQEGGIGIFGNGTLELAGVFGNIFGGYSDIFGYGGDAIRTSGALKISGIIGEIRGGWGSTINGRQVRGGYGINSSGDITISSSIGKISGGEGRNSSSSSFRTDGGIGIRGSYITITGYVGAIYGGRAQGRRVEEEGGHGIFVFGLGCGVNLTGATIPGGVHGGDAVMGGQPGRAINGPAAEGWTSAQHWPY